MEANDLVLEEIEGDYKPREEEIKEYALYLGMNLEEDKDLLWIAEKGLTASVPKPWKPCRTAEGNIYYFNFVTGQSSWEHPFDEESKKLYKKEKEKKIIKLSELEHQYATVVILLLILDNGERI